MVVTQLDLTADNLSAEEMLLWHTACTWRNLIGPNQPLPDLDWPAFVKMVVKGKPLAPYVELPPDAKCRTC